MTRQEAIELYLSKTARARDIVERLSAWDASKTLTENKKIMKTVLTNVAVFAERYELSYSKKRKNGTPLNRDKIQKMLIAGLTQAEIARLCRISRQRVYQLLNVKDRTFSTTNGRVRLGKEK